MRRLNHRTSRHPRGSMFAYAMAYMTLSLLLLGLMGTTLHLLMRSSRTDERIFLDLARVRALETGLRDDVSLSTAVEFSSDSATFSTTDGASIWTIDRHTITRERTREGNRASASNIRFRTGTTVEFVEQSPTLFSVRITPPTPGTISRQQQSPDSGTAFNSIEVLLPRLRDTAGSSNPDTS